MSGKSTWSKRALSQCDDETVIVSSDCFRDMFHGKYLYNLKFEPLVVQSTLNAISLAIKSKYNVIVDEALLSLDVIRRMTLVNLIKSYDDTIKIKFVSFEPATSLINIESRIKEHHDITKTRWKQIYEELLTSYQPVQDTEPYDSIEYIDVSKQLNHE